MHMQNGEADSLWVALHCVVFESDNMASSRCIVRIWPSIQSVYWRSVIATRSLWEWQHGIQWMHCERMALYPVSIMEISDCNAWFMRMTTWHPVDALWAHDPLSSQYNGDQWLQCVGYESDNMASSRCIVRIWPSIQSVYWRSVIATRSLWEWQHGIQWMHCERMALYPVSIMEISDCNAWFMRMTTWHPVDALWAHDPLSSQYNGDQWLQCVGYESDNMASSGCNVSAWPSIQSV